MVSRVTGRGKIFALSFMLDPEAPSDLGLSRIGGRYGGRPAGAAAAPAFAGRGGVGGVGAREP